MLTIHIEGPTNTPTFYFRPKGDYENEHLITGHFEFKSLWDRPIAVAVINRLAKVSDKESLSRSEYDASRIAQFFEAWFNIRLTWGEFPDPERKPREAIVVDLRAELPTDPPHEKYYKGNPYF